MDWKLAIRRNRDALRDIAAALFLAARLRVGGSLTTLPRSTVAMIMAVLRPAESAVRRLIVIVAAGLELQPLSNVIVQSPHLGGDVAGGDRGGSYRAFQLFDPLKSFDPDSIWDSEPVFESGYSLAKSTPWHDASADHSPIDARPLALRLNALMRALGDLPRQARRLKRWELRRNALLKAAKPTRLSPIRPGLPPGWRERKVHEIDDVLKECHRLAWDRLDRPDTS